MKSKETNNTNVPKLRFPEFLEAEVWEEKCLGQIGEFIGGGTPDTSISEYWDGEIQWFTPTEIKERNLFKSKRTITEKGLYNSSAKLLPQGALLITTRATIGDIGIANIPCATNQGFQSLLTYDSEVNFFWYYWFIQHKNELISKASGSTFPEIGKTEIVKILTLRPKKKEQQKIASCLSSLDDIITAQSQKLETLKAHKKGLMQQLFPAEGETVPKLRFSEFRKAGKWKKKTLKEVSKLISEKAGDRKYTLMSINAGIGLVSQIEKFGREIAGDAYKNYIVIHKEDFAYNKSSTKFYPEGQIAMLENAEIGAVPNSIFTCFRVNLELIFPFFLKYLFEGNNHGKWLKKFIVIGARAHGALNVDNKDFFSLPIFFPNLSEQQKIADCLSSLDDLISAQSQKLDALKTHKNGLMQQLFPNINNTNK